MKIPIPWWCVRAMDAIVVAVFPSRKYIDCTLALYFLAFAVATAWWTQSWRSGGAVILCAASAYLMDKMLNG